MTGAYWQARSVWTGSKPESQHPPGGVGRNCDPRGRISGRYVADPGSDAIAMGSCCSSRAARQRGVNADGIANLTATPGGSKYQINQDPLCG